LWWRLLLSALHWGMKKPGRNEFANKTTRRTVNVVKVKTEELPSTLEAYR